MLKGSWCRTLCLLLWSAAASPTTYAQQPAAAGELNPIRTLNTVSPSGQRQIRDWIDVQVTAMERSRRPDRFRTFRQAFTTERKQATNTLAFVEALVAETAGATTDYVKKDQNDPLVCIALMRVVVDMKRIQTLEALLAGLGSPVEGCRFFAAKGLLLLRGDIVTDKSRHDRVIAALKAAGIAEAKPVVLGRIYGALTFDVLTPEVFDAYVAILDKRLEPPSRGSGSGRRRGGGPYRVLPHAGYSQRAQREPEDPTAAASSRVPAARCQRYTIPGIEKDEHFYERDNIEQMLEGIEAIFCDLMGQNRTISNLLATGGPINSAEILQEVLLWIGDSESDTAGRLNAEPWNVPVGAP